MTPEEILKTCKSAAEWAPIMGRNEKYFKQKAQKMGIGVIFSRVRVLTPDQAKKVRDYVDTKK